MRLRAKEQFNLWLAESADMAEGKVTELLAQMEEGMVPEAPLITYAHLWHSDYSGIRSQIWHLYNDNHDTEELGEFAQADLLVYIYRKDGQLIIWFQCEWEASDELASEMVEDIEWDDYDLYLEQVNDTEEAASALAELLNNLWCTEAEGSADPARLEFLLAKENFEVDFYLAKNKEAGPELLVTLEDRYNGSKNDKIATLAKENPNYPEDKVEWALGDW